MKKLSKIASVLAMTFVGFCLVACQQPTTENSNGLATLPGTAGGSTNSKDIFAGKTFYDNADESKAFGKYVFGTNGTIQFYSRYGDSEGKKDEWTILKEEYKYSLSSDGSTMWQIYNRVSFADDGKLQTYQEALNDENTKKIAKNNWDTNTNDEKEKMLHDLGLPSTATFEQVYQAYIKSFFSVVWEYKITSDAKDDAGNSCIKLTRIDEPLYFYPENKQ